MRWFHRMSMMRAIRIACSDAGIKYQNPVRKAAGLRMIRIWEEVSQSEFDPLNRAHLHAVHGNARYFDLVRGVQLIFKRHRKA